MLGAEAARQDKIQSIARKIINVKELVPVAGPIRTT